MEEQILKIILSGYIQRSGTEDPDRRVAKEITSHVMEFILWIIADSYRYFEQGYSNGKDHFYEMESGDEVTLEEVYQYWLTNVKQ
jgi:hypothetical protein